MFIDSRREAFVRAFHCKRLLAGASSSASYGISMQSTPVMSHCCSRVNSYASGMVAISVCQLATIKILNGSAFNFVHVWSIEKESSLLWRSSEASGRFLDNYYIKDYLLY